MAKHTIEISDENGKSFRILVSIGYFGFSTGKWRSLDKGRIRYNSGTAEYCSAGGYREERGKLYSSAPLAEPTVRHLLLFDPQNQYGGLRLNDYIRLSGVEDQGTGYLWQPWGLDFEPSRIYWALVD